MLLSAVTDRSLSGWKNPGSKSERMGAWVKRRITANGYTPYVCARARSYDDCRDLVDVPIHSKAKCSAFSPITERTGLPMAAAWPLARGSRRAK